MEIDAVKLLVEKGMPDADAEVEVTGDGRHFEVMVISDAFEGLSLLKRHRMVLDTVNTEIASDELHALSIKAHTRAEKG